MSANGTNRTNRGGLMMSVVRGERKSHFRAARTVFDPGCVKTSTSREPAEFFSLFAFFDGARQRCSFLIQLIRGKRSTRKSDFGVFTQPGSKAPFWRSDGHFRSTPMNRHSLGTSACLKTCHS